MENNQKQTIEIASLIIYAGLLFVALFLIAKVGMGMWEEVGNAYAREVSSISGF